MFYRKKKSDARKKKTMIIKERTNTCHKKERTK